MIRKRTRFTVLALAAGLALTGCAAGGAPEETAAPVVAGGTLEIAWNAQPATLDPVVTTSSATRDIVNNVFEGLFASDAEAHPQPMLAEGYEVNADFTEYTIALREGVLFHNGDEMTSTDVVASFDRWIRDSSIGKQDFVGAVVAAVDDYTITVTTAAPFFNLIDMTAPPSQGLIIVPEESIAAITETGMPETAIIGTGPYKFVEWVKDQQITLDRFEDYVGVDTEPSGLAGSKAAYLDELVYNMVPDATTRVNGLQTGEYDFASTLPADNLAQLESAGLTMSTEFIYQFLFVTNKASGFFADENARQGLFYAIDPTPIMTAAYAGADFFELNGSLNAPRQAAWFTEAGIDDKYNNLDLDKAAELFEEAGYNGETIRIITTRDYPDSYNASVVLEQQLKDAGLNAELVVSDQATLLASRAEAEGWDIFPTALGLGAPETFLPLKSTWPGSTSSVEIAEALAAVKLSTSDEEAFAAREALQEEFYAYAPAVKVGDAATLSGYSAEVGGYTYLYGPIFFNTYKNQ